MAAIAYRSLRCHTLPCKCFYSTASKHGLLLRAPPKVMQIVAEQDVTELHWFLKHFVRGRRSILEIGSASGRSLREFASVMAPGSVVRSVARLWAELKEAGWHAAECIISSMGIGVICR